MAGADDTRPLLLIAAGGTGGHMFPAQALAEVMLARGWRVQLSTDGRGARYATGFPEGVAVRQVPAATFARGGVLAKALVPLVLAAGVAGALIGALRDRPAVVVGFGGYPTIPALVAAFLLRLPRMIHEQNGVPGRVNRLFGPRVAALACGTWPTALPAGVRGIHTGNPVRASVLARTAAPYIPPGDYPMSVVVMGGSQGARILSQVVPAALAALPDELRHNLRVAHQARPEDADAAANAYDAAGLPAEVSPFFADIPRRLSEAQLVISRAGASSVADIAVIGRPAILVPYAAALDDHQSANAQALVEAGGAIRIAEDALTPDSLREAVALVLGDPDGAARMARAATAAGLPDAAERLAALVEAVAAGRDPHQDEGPTP